MDKLPDWLTELEDMREDDTIPLPSVQEISHRILQEQINTLKQCNLRTLDVLETVALKVAELMAMVEKLKLQL